MEQGWKEVEEIQGERKCRDDKFASVKVMACKYDLQ